MLSLQEILESQGLLIKPFEGTLNLQSKKGINPSRANIDPENSQHMNERELRFYARGIQSVLSQPQKSIVKKWGFRLSAASLLPSIETQSFVKGVEDASGSPALFLPLIDDLVIVFGVQWDRGFHIITRLQFESWQVNIDRVRAAARSMLYHHSEHSIWTHETEDVLRISVGDGSDAARYMIIEDKYFGELDENFRFAMPSPDHFLAIKNGEHLEALSDLSTSIFESSPHPLSNSIFAFRKGRLYIPERL